MHSKIFSLFLQYLIFCKQYNFSYMKAIVGFNIRFANENEFISTASIISKLKRKFDSQYDHVCTAVMVTKKHALTAEHCTCDRLANCRLMLGSRRLNSGHEHKIKAWISYAEWCKKQNIIVNNEDHDISVVTLEDSVNPNIQNFKPAPLSNKPGNKLYGKNVVIAGWGKSNDGTISILMQTVVLKVITRRECTKRINDLAKAKTHVPESLICTIGEPFALLGPGESGGPLLDHNNNLVGINVATCPKTEDGMNTKEVNLHSSVKYYRPFIDDVISQD